MNHHWLVPFMNPIYTYSGCNCQKQEVRARRCVREGARAKVRAPHAKISRNPTSGTYAFFKKNSMFCTKGIDLNAKEGAEVKRLFG